MHPNDVWVYVLSCEMACWSAKRCQRRPGQLGAEATQRGAREMWNSATVSARVVEVLTPGGSERWFEELAGCHLAMRPDLKTPAVGTAFVSCSGL